MAAPRHSLGRGRRIRRRRSFERIQANARSARTRHFILLVAAQPASDAAPGGRARLGVVASRRIGGAVVRNRVKRLCRECFRTQPALLPDGVDLVVIARAGADSLKLQEVQAEWESVSGALQKLARDALARTDEQHHVSPDRGGPRAGRTRAPKGKDRGKKLVR